MLANCLGISKIKYLCYEDMSSLCPVDGDHLSEKIPMLFPTLHIWTPISETSLGKHVRFTC